MTVIPCWPSSSASVLVSTDHAALGGRRSAPESCAPDWALDDEMVTIRPHPPAIMSGTASCRQWNVPVRLTAEHAVPVLHRDLQERGVQ